MIRYAVAALLACGIVPPSPTPAQSVIAGTVRRDSTAAPLAAVEVLLEGSPRRTLTGTEGRFVLGGVAPGEYVILFRAVGFRPLRERILVGVEDTVRVAASLVPQGVQRLEELDVTGRVPAPRGIGREAFDERRKLGFGKFIDSAEMRRSEVRRPSDMLRGIPGVNVVRFRECEDSRRCGPVEERAASSRGMQSMVMMARPGMDYCWMSVLLDGNPLYLSGSSRPPPDFSRDFRVSDLESVEIYRSSAEVPTEYGGTAAQCGVIVLWSRRH